MKFELPVEHIQWLNTLAKAGLDLAQSLSRRDAAGAQKKCARRIKQVNVLAPKIEALPVVGFALPEQWIKLKPGKVMEWYCAIAQVAARLNMEPASGQTRVVYSWLSASVAQVSYLLLAMTDSDPKYLKKAVKLDRSCRQPIPFLKSLQKRSKKLQSRLGDLAVPLCLGEPVQWADYLGLNSGLSKGRVVQVSRAGPTRSGSKILFLESRRKQGGVRQLVFKSGPSDKIKREFKSIVRWQEINPGITAKVVAFNKAGEQSSVLLKRLNGQTFEFLLRQEDKHLFKLALDVFLQSLKTHWHQTTEPSCDAGSFMQQLKDRLSAVQKTHSQFEYRERWPLSDLMKNIELASKVEQKCACPVSVLGHGDMNVDNLLIEPEAKKLYFVDLHRSAPADYLQDATVFMVSCIRLGLSGKEYEKRVKKLIKKMSQLCAQFAREHGDTTFQTRLRLGIARSLITSTRFVENVEFADRLYERGFWLLEQVIKGSYSKVDPDMRFVKEFYVSP